jgi:hypothetical protein
MSPLAGAGRVKGKAQSTRTTVSVRPTLLAHTGSTVLNAIEREMKGSRRKLRGVICSIISIIMILSIVKESFELRLLLRQKLEPTAFMEESIPIA